MPFTLCGSAKGPGFLKMVKRLLSFVKSSKHSLTAQDFFTMLSHNKDKKNLWAIFYLLSDNWEAPGSGKIRLALCQAKIYFTEDLRRIANFVATKNAFEQIWHGVLSIERKTGRSDANFQRMSTPWSKLALAFIVPVRLLLA